MDNLPRFRALGRSRDPRPCRWVCAFSKQNKLAHPQLLTPEGVVRHNGGGES